MANWSIDKARELYNIQHWSEGFFDINEKGHVCAYPKSAQIDLYEVVKTLKQHDLSLPVLVRFTDILQQRIAQLTAAFTTAMSALDYQSRFIPVYPIKVNQQNTVVHGILAHKNVGLEAGSKPELLAVLGVAEPNSVIICNGYKDREFVRLGLIGQMLGHEVYLIIEKASELALILAEAKQLGIKPRLGVRIRLASIGKGYWQNTGGEKSKFGLTATQVLQLIENLKQEDHLDCLKLLHFHLGSQIANIRDFQHCVREAARHYVELRQLGVNIETIDVGGGLGIDYEGTRSRNFFSRNYTIEEYARNIVSAIVHACNEHELPHPQIITESGRAMTAHHAVLITNVIDMEQPDPSKMPLCLEDDAPAILQDLYNGYHDLDQRSALETYHEATYLLTEVYAMYNHGVLNLSQRAQAEQLFFAICAKLQGLLHPTSRTHREILAEIQEKLAAKFYLNLSIFQSLPDIWALKQIFPIMPLTRLNEMPEQRAIMQDLTCDSDGRIDQYVDGVGIESSLPLPAYRHNEPYYLGIFLVGAYQEILGDMHNLFGDTHSVNVRLTANGSYELFDPHYGDTVASVLRTVRFESESLLQSYQTQLNNRQLSATQREQFLLELQEGLQGYTYFEE